MKKLAAFAAAAVIIAVGLWVSMVTGWEAGLRRGGGWVE